MSILSLLLIVAILAYASLRLANNYVTGLNTVICLLVSLPHELRLEPGGAFPAITIHRFLLVLLALFWAFASERTSRLRSCPWLAPLGALALCEFISALLSIQPLASFKNSLSLTFEIILLYLIVATSVSSEKEVMSVIKAIVLGLSVVAALAFVEKYTHFNPVDIFVNPNRRIATMFTDIQSTYSHRILLGYAMTYGLILTHASSKSVKSKTDWRALFLSSLFLGACYFSTSRGPWLGIIVSAIILFTLGSHPTRRTLMTLGAITLAVFLLWGGVRFTIVSSAQETFDSTTSKGKSYDYRWKLWSVAYEEISKSPDRFFFGYGGNSTDFMDLSQYFERQQGGTTINTGFTSWDNQFASDLIEFGIVGFAVSCWLWAAVLRRTWRLRQALRLTLADLSASTTACIVLYLVAMTNVTIFAPQLKYLLWVVAGLVAVLERTPARVAAPAIEEPLSFQGPSLASPLINRAMRPSHRL